MENRTNNSPSNKRPNKDRDKREQLTKYVFENKYINVDEQPKVCAKFGLTYERSIFQTIYRKRFFKIVYNTTTTLATVEKATGIPHKYLCWCKRYYENKGVLRVVTVGICPTSGRKNVQFVSTNPEYVYKDNQLRIWDETE